MSSDRIARRERDPGEGLLAHPQTLGIVPTWSFWRGQNARLIRGPSGIVAAAITVALGLSGLPWYVVAPLGAATYTILLGGLERYIRARARARRTRAQREIGRGTASE